VLNAAAVKAAAATLGDGALTWFSS